MVAMRWETDTRYYVCDLHQDLLGDWVMLQSWGGKFNRLGRQSFKVVDSEAQACELIVQLHRTRIKRGYDLVRDNHIKEH